MMNIMKSVCYGLRKNTLYTKGFLAFLAISFIITIPILTENDNYTVSEFVADGGMMEPALLFMGIVVCSICVGDSKDKTMNYELLTGHSRKEIFLGRTIVALFVGVAGTILINIIPVIVTSFVFGWGGKITIGAYASHILLSGFPILRYGTALVFLSFAFRDVFKAAGIGIAYRTLTGMLVDAMHGNAYITSMHNLNEVLCCNAWETYTLSGTQVQCYDATIPLQTVVLTIAVSLASGGILLLLAYYYFKKDDVA